MPKKFRFGTLMHGPHVKGSERLLKSARQYFCYIFRSLWMKVSSKSCVLVLSETFRVFVKILTPDQKYSLSVKASVYFNQSKCYSLQTKKHFRNFFRHFKNLHKICNNLKEKDEPWRLFLSGIIESKMWIYLHV